MFRRLLLGFALLILAGAIGTGVQGKAHAQTDSPTKTMQPGVTASQR